MLATDQPSPSNCFRRLASAQRSIGVTPVGRRLTPLRDIVLRTMRDVGKPVSAYEVIERLAPQVGRKLAPTTVYRALAYLVTQRLIARIESRNAYSAMPPHHAGVGAVFCICDHCGVAELVASRSCERAADQEAATLGFRVERRVIELQGTCARCLSVHFPSTRHSAD